MRKKRTVEARVSAGIKGTGVHNQFLIRYGSSTIKYHGRTSGTKQNRTSVKSTNGNTRRTYPQGSLPLRPPDLISYETFPAYL